MCIRDRLIYDKRVAFPEKVQAGIQFRAVLLSDKVRLATEQDFADFHICFDGFRNKTMYCYNQGTEPI